MIWICNLNLVTLENNLNLSDSNMQLDFTSACLNELPLVLSETLIM